MSCVVRWWDVLFVKGMHFSSKNARLLNYYSKSRYNMAKANCYLTRKEEKRDREWLMQRSKINEKYSFASQQSVSVEQCDQILKQKVANFFKKLHKIGHNSFYLKSAFVKLAMIVINNLHYVCKENRCQLLPIIAQSCHTGVDMLADVIHRQISQVTQFAECDK